MSKKETLDELERRSAVIAERKALFERGLACGVLHWGTCPRPSDDWFYPETPSRWWSKLSKEIEQAEATAAKGRLS